MTKKPKEISFCWEKIFSRLEEIEMSQSEFLRQGGFAMNTLKKLKKRDGHGTRVETLIKMAKILGVHPGYFFA